MCSERHSSVYALYGGAGLPLVEQNWLSRRMWPRTSVYRVYLGRSRLCADADPLFGPSSAGTILRLSALHSILPLAHAMPGWRVLGVC